MPNVEGLSSDTDDVRFDFGEIGIKTLGDGVSINAGYADLNDDALNAFVSSTDEIEAACAIRETGQYFLLLKDGYLANDYRTGEWVKSRGGLCLAKTARTASPSAPIQSIVLEDSFLPKIFSEKYWLKKHPTVEVYPKVWTGNSLDWRVFFHEVDV